MGSNNSLIRIVYAKWFQLKGEMKKKIEAGNTYDNDGGSVSFVISLLRQDNGGVYGRCIALWVDYFYD